MPLAAGLNLLLIWPGSTSVADPILFYRRLMSFGALVSAGVGSALVYFSMGKAASSDEYLWRRYFIFLGRCRRGLGSTRLPTSTARLLPAAAAPYGCLTRSRADTRNAGWAMIIQSIIAVYTVYKKEHRMLIILVFFVTTWLMA